MSAKTLLLMLISVVVVSAMTTNAPSVHKLPDGFTYLWRFYEEKIKPIKPHLKPVGESLRYGEQLCAISFFRLATNLILAFNSHSGKLQRCHRFRISRRKVSCGAHWEGRSGGVHCPGECPGKRLLTAHLRRLSTTKSGRLFLQMGHWAGKLCQVQGKLLSSSVH